MWAQRCAERLSARRLVSSPDPTPKRRRDIGADSWFCKLSNHVIICIGLYWNTCSHVMVRTTKKRPQMSPDPFLACVMGSGNVRFLHDVNSLPACHTRLHSFWKLEVKGQTPKHEFRRFLDLDQQARKLGSFLSDSAVNFTIPYRTKFYSNWCACWNS